MRRNGFTLVEIIVVMAITAIVGTILVVIFTNTLRGSNKAQILAVIKQNGQSVLENMDKTIRGADSIVCPAGNTNTLVVEKNGEYTRYRIVDSYIVQDAGQKCEPDDPMMPSAQILTDTNSQTGVKVDSGSFVVSKPDGYKASVTINFTLSPANSAFASQIDPVTFQTTIGLR